MSQNLLMNRVIRNGILLYARTDQFFTRVQEAARNAISGFFDNALTVEEKAELGIVLYDYSLRRLSPERGLWKWEQAWFNERLPKPPCRLLIGAAGTGREAVALSKSGYYIDALEPAPLAAKRCAEALGDRGRVFVGRYEDLNRAIIDQKGGLLTEIASESYDAIILGWTSLSHVVDSIERKRLLQACRRLGTNAPVLASFWLKRTDDSVESNSRAKKAGSRFGSIVARFRGNRSRPFGETFGSVFGFAHIFTKKEIEELADCSQSSAVWDSINDHPHVTFVPK
jgi:hypothetical protein